MGFYNCQPQLVGAHFYNHQLGMIVVVAVVPNQAPHLRNPSDHPQRPRGPPARSKATWSFAPALALLEKVPWLLAGGFWRTVSGVNSLQKNSLQTGIIQWNGPFLEVSKLWCQCIVVPFLVGFVGFPNFLWCLVWGGYNYNDPFQKAAVQMRNTDSR